MQYFFIDAFITIARHGPNFRAMRSSTMRRGRRRGARTYINMIIRGSIIRINGLLHHRIDAIDGLLFMLTYRMRRTFRLQINTRRFRARHPNNTSGRPCDQGGDCPSMLNTLRLGRRGNTRCRHCNYRRLIKGARRQPRTLGTTRQVSRTLVRRMTPRARATHDASSANGREINFFRRQSRIARRILRRGTTEANAHVRHNRSRRNFRRGARIVPRTRIDRQRRFIRRIDSACHRHQHAAYAIRSEELAGIFHNLRSLL